MKKYVKKGMKEFIGSQVLSVADVILTAVYPFLLTYIIDNITTISSHKLIIVFGTFVASIVLLLLEQYLNKIVKQKYEKKIVHLLRHDLFNKLLDMDESTFYQEEPDVYASFLVNDIKSLYTLYFENLIYFVNEILKLVTYTVILFRINWVMCLVIIGSLLLLVFMPQLVGGKFESLNQDVSEKNADYLSSMTSFLESHEILDARKPAVQRRHETILNGLQESVYRQGTYRSFTQIFSGSALYIQLIICFITGVILTYRQVITVGTLSACMIYVEYISMVSCNLLGEILDMKSSAVYRTRLASYLKKENAELKATPAAAGTVSVRNLSYTIGERQLFDNLSYQFEAGRKYVITGDNGCGKSTFLKILAQHIAADGDCLAVNRDEVTYISQNRYLFEGSVLENVLLFGESNEEIEREIASYLTSLHFAHGLEYQIEKDGTNLSGGEKAKICLVRGLIQKKKIMMIDEPFNDVDEESGILLEQLLTASSGTTIMVSHLLHDRNRYDEILVMQDGKLHRS